MPAGGRFCTFFRNSSLFNHLRTQKKLKLFPRPVDTTLAHCNAQSDYKKPDGGTDCATATGCAIGTLDGGGKRDGANGREAPNAPPRSPPVFTGRTGPFTRRKRQ